MTYPFTPHLPDRGSDGLSVHLLGTVDWPSARALQERLAFDLSGRTDRHGFLLLCEHPPGVTVGREGSRADLRCDERDLRSRSMATDWVARGGGVIVHSPGQLCAYPVLPVAARGGDAGDDETPLTPALLRDVLVSAAAATCDDLRVANEITPDGAAVAARTGVVAEVGVAVRNGFSRWGLFLSVAPAMEFPRMAVRPDGSQVSSLSAARHNPVSMPAVRSSLVRRLAEGLGYDTVHTFTGHPLLRRSTQRTYVPA